MVLAAREVRWQGLDKDRWEGAVGSRSSVREDKRLRVRNFAHALRSLPACRCATVARYAALEAST